MGNVLLYTLLMAGFAFAIGFFVAFIIKIVFSSIQRMTRAQTVEFKTGMKRVRHINRIRRKNYLSALESFSENKDKLHSSRLSVGKNDSKAYTNEIVEYYYGKS